ncbi:MAG: S24/S26 family peptidase [Anaerolineae bacterium]
MPLAARSLVVASLEIGRVLADRGKVTFRAQGTCMFPCVQPGDVLHIESRPIEQVAVGDIAVFRRGAALFGHRAIAKGIDNGKPYIVTRPDRTKQGGDGSTYGDDVLGVVTAIERRGARMPLHPQPLRGVAALRAAGWEWWNWEAFPRLIERIGAVQRRAWYRRLASAWLNMARPRLSYRVRLPLNAAQSHDLYRELSPDAFDVSKSSWQGRGVTMWMLALHLNGARPPAASVTINWHPDGCPRGAGWHVDEMQTRVRYRGAGLDDALIAQAEAILARGGMDLQRTHQRESEALDPR